MATRTHTKTFFRSETLQKFSKSLNLDEGLAKANSRRDEDFAVINCDVAVERGGC